MIAESCHFIRRNKNGGNSQGKLNLRLTQMCAHTLVVEIQAKHIRCPSKRHIQRNSNNNNNLNKHMEPKRGDRGERDARSVS